MRASGPEVAGVRQGRGPRLQRVGVARPHGLRDSPRDSHHATPPAFSRGIPPALYRWTQSQWRAGTRACQNGASPAHRADLIDHSGP